MYSGVDNTNNITKEKKLSEEKNEDLKDKRPQRRMRINLNNLTDKTPQLSKNNGFIYCNSN